MTMTEESYSVYNAVYAVAHSLHEMILSQVQDQTEANKDITLSSLGRQCHFHCFAPSETGHQML